MSSTTELTFDPYGDVILVLSKPIPPDTTEPTVEPIAAQNADDADHVEPDATTSNPDESYEADLPETQKIEEIRIRMSSRRLVLALKVFRLMFDGPYRERVEPGKGLPIEVALPDDDPGRHVDSPQSHSWIER